jgi:hypothetical protein
MESGVYRTGVRVCTLIRNRDTVLHSIIAKPDCLPSVPKLRPTG